MDDLGRRWRVRPLADRDHDRWRTLYAAYAAFYRSEQTDEHAERTWRWLRDPTHPVEGLVVEDEAGSVAGLAHVRPFPRPLSASVGGFLDDLYVDEPARGTGAVDALLDALRERAAERGWSVVRWITAHDNARAQAKYDQVATRTSWVTYDLQPGPRPDPPPASASTSLHLSQHVRCSPEAAYGFASDPANLSRWAAGLGGQVVHADGQWRVTSPSGDVLLAFAPPNDLGVLDHTVVLPDGTQVHNPMRVLPDGDGCEVVFTLRRQAWMTDDDLDRDAAAVRHDLAVLRDLLEAAATG